MEHGELLQELDGCIADFDLRFDNANLYYKALREVVKLHFPSEGCCYVCIKEISVIGHTTDGKEIWTNIENYDYPCPTIQAIEKELNNG